MADVAIIGISAILPGASTLEQFHHNLRDGVDAVRPMPRVRRKYSRVKKDDYQVAGYLDRVDEFDPAFFHISQRDAERMDPQQRILLEQSCAAIENAGYSLAELRGSRTGVYVGALPTNYIENPIDPSTVTGNIAAPLAGRISYVLDLRGPAMVLDTACSSSLVAVHQACGAIALGECDYAIAAGITIFIDFYQKAKGRGVLGVVSPDGRSKAFDASADGTGLGEGVGVVLLKALDRALRDRDVIHAVIRSTSVNQDGGRSNGLTAPSPGAQTDVISQAWERAGVDPTTIEFLEAHGTGTKLGDPIEIDGMNAAFARHTDARGFCAVSAVKSNIGHLGSAAGIAGLIKVVLALQHRVFYPSLHFHTPNPLIDFDSGAVRVNSALRPWPASSAHPRRAGVSSFGVSGTNAHAVLEEAPPVPARSDVADEGPCLVTLSARTGDGLVRYAERLAECLGERLAERLYDPLARTTAPLADIAYVLNAGRDDHAHRWAWTVDSVAQLREQVAAAAAGAAATGAGESTAAGARGVVFLVSDQVDGYLPELADAPGWGALRRALAAMPAPAPEIVHDVGQRAQVAAFRTLYALCRALRDLGITASTVIGSGLGNTVVGAVLDRYPVEEGYARAAAFELPGKALDRDRLAQVMRTLCKDGAPVFVEIGPPGALREAMGSLPPGVVSEAGPEAKIDILPTWPAAGSGSLLDTLAALYRRGAAIDWARHYHGQERRRVVLPSYPFERRRCWLGEPFTDAELDATVSAKAYTGERDDPALLLGGPRSTEVSDDDATDTERRLAPLWGEILKVTEVARGADFLELGGDSLNGVQLIARIAETFGVELDVLDLFDYATLSEMAAQIDAARAARAAGTTQPAARDSATTAGPAAPARPEVLIPVTGATTGPLSSTQRQVYYLCQLEPERSLYCVSMSFHVRGALDVDALGESFDRLVRRHSVLRTTYSSDGLTQQVHGPELFGMRVVDLRDRAEADARAEMAAQIERERARGFDLGKDAPLRVVLYRLRDDLASLWLAIHHIASDGWSLGILSREVATTYAALTAGSGEDRGAALPALPVQYIDYARWQRERLDSGAMDEDVRYWVERLTPVPEPLQLPQLGAATAGAAAAGVRVFRTMPAPLREALHRVCQREEVTLFMALLSGYAALLHRYTGQRDLVIGTPVANRFAQVEQVIGFFSNTLPLRLDLSGEPSFQALLQRVKTAALDGIRHQAVPLDKIIQVLRPEREASGSPIVQTVFALQNAPMEMTALPGLDVSVDLPDTSIAQFGLALSLRETPDGIVEFAESHGHLDESALSRLLQHLETLLDAALREPQAPISGLVYLTEEEQRDVLMNWSDPRRSSSFDLDW